MAAYELCPVSADTVKAIFDALEILDKIDRSDLTTEDAARARANLYRRGFSCTRKHRRRTGFMHVATTRVVTDASGVPQYRHGKDIVLGRIKVVAGES